MTFGLTPEGFNRKRLPDLKAEEENAMIAEFGDVNVQPQSVFGQFIGVMSKAFADLWEELEDVYFSQYPGTAEGVALDYAVALNGITRLPAERTSVIGVVEAVEGTLITEGALVRQPNTNQNFFASSDTTITSGDAVDNLVSVDALAGQIYNTLINGVSHIYSLPKIEFEKLFVTSNSIVVSINSEKLTSVPFNTDSQTTMDDLVTAIQAVTDVDTATARIGLVVTFDSDFVASNSIVATINGSALSAVPFNTDQATTISDLASAIQADASVTSATVTDTREITVVPVDEGTFLIDSIVTTGGASQPVPIDQRIDITAVDGSSVTVNFITITGGASKTPYNVSHLEPTTIDEIVSGLVSVINASNEPVTATDNADETFSVLADDSAVSYSISISTNMTIQEVSSPVIFLAENFGEIPAPIGSLTEILTPIGGWESITNLKAGVTGREIETDAELRLRRQNSIRVLGAATVESIRARILQEVSGVTQALVFENRTMTEEDLVVIFDSDFVTSNEIVFTINGIVQPTITFSSSHLNTMQLIEVQLESLPEIKAVTVGGTGNRTLTIEMNQGYEVTINDIDITLGASQPLYNIQGGRFPKSFEAVVKGGTDEDVGNKIWETKPSGIQTFGNTSYTVTDSMGFSQVMNFSRPTPIYIWVDVDLTLYDEETFPNNGADLIEQAIVDYGETLEIGDDVLKQRVLCQIFEVTGVASGSMQIASTLNQTDTPSFGTADIDIGDNQLAIFALTRTSAQVV